MTPHPLATWAQLSVPPQRRVTRQRRRRRAARLLLAGGTTWQPPPHVPRPARTDAATRSTPDTGPALAGVPTGVPLSPSGRAATRPSSHTGSVGLVDRAVRAVDQEPVEAAGEPAVVGHREHRALEGLEPLLQRLGRLHVEVVGRLVEQQQRRAGQLEQQDLEARLLAAGQRLEALLGGVRQLVAVQRPRRRLARHPVAVLVARGAGSPAGCGRPARGARGSARTSPGRTRAPSRARPVCGTGFTGTSPTGRCSTSGSLPPAASSRRKCDLPEPFEPSTATRSPYQTSRSNGRISPVSSSCSQTTARLPVRPPLQPHRDLLLARLIACGGPASSNLRSRVWAAWYCEAMPALYSAFSCSVSTSALQLGVLLVPAPAQLLEPARSARAAPRGTTRSHRDGSTRCCPRRAELDGDHPGRGVVQQLAVVADEQDRLGRLADPLLQPGLAGHVEEVVRLVEQQHLVGPAQQELQHQPLLLAAGQRARGRGTSPGRTAPRARRCSTRPRPPRCRSRRRRPTRPAPRRSASGSSRRRCSISASSQRVDLAAAARGPAAGRPTAAARATVVEPAAADHLPHHAEPAGAGDRARVRGQVAGDDPQQGGLARRRWRRPARPWRPRRPGTTRRRAAPARPAARSALRRRPRDPRGHLSLPGRRWRNRSRAET